MGVKNLWDILESCKKKLPLHHLQNKRVCVDLSCWMVQLQNVNKSHTSLKDKLYLKGLFHRIRALIALNCSLIFVTDGSIPAIKLDTYRRRLNLGCEVQDETNSQKVCALRRNMGSEFSCMIKEAKALGMALGIPCLDGVEEGEAQCALLDMEMLCDGCFSSDSDVFLFGARTVYRDICLGDGGYITCYEMDDIEKKLGYARNSLIALAVLLGGDYSQGVYGLGPESACQIVKTVGDSFVLQKIASEGLSFAKKAKSKKQGLLQKCNNKEDVDPQMNIKGSEHELQSGKQFVQIINAYLKPKCHPAESDAVYRALAQYPFSRAKLQQICFKFFEWPPEKTGSCLFPNNEYILPKIAERDLRRFAHLRATSSDIVHLPLEKMPVKCPVSEIIKPRKVQGIKCYEVAWDDVDGLRTSIVPADLIEGACHEKIIEFEERRAQGKKKQDPQKPRTHKLKNKASATELEKKLQDLLLGIEEDIPKCNPLSTTVPHNKVPEMDMNLVTLDQLLDSESQYSFDQNAATCSHQTGQNKSEVIDLLSPSPQVRTRNFTKCEQASGKCIDVIDLSDSETDRSAEHERKARKLRYLLATLKSGNS
ncbi:XPG-I domain [Dillenia turbinata]|uniref:Single-strand DNA endonuclease 1 n=1 Tax=Dillenia turbinata TaxID=194707 RepID=A0AAN8VUR8_9MAGN